MNARPRPNVAGLHWVRGEIEQSLTRARTLVEQHVENPGDPLPLQQAFVELHQVRGTASMIQCFGVSALAEEMKQSLNDLMQGRVKEAEASFSALLGATVQLGDYIDALADGTDDCALILQPAINELRLARSRTVLTEADLFVAQMQSLGLALPMPESDARVDGAAQQQAKKLLPIFQASLLQWLKSEPDSTTALARLGKISEQVSQAAVNPALYQLWRTVAACVEAILGHALEDSLELKRLFGRAGAQLKVLAEDGEGPAGNQVADLPLHLLFYVGRSRGQGPRVMAQRKVFQLHIFLPSAAYVEELRRKIHGPNTTLLARVSDEIRADFAKVKDAIDLAVRAGGRSALDMNTTRTSLKRISDTLSVLGLTVLQRVVANQSRQLEAAEAPDQAMWMDLATSILRVENSLEDALFKQLRKPRDQERVELEEQIPHSRDLAEGISALYRESLVNLAKLKSQADVYIKSGDQGALADAGRLLDEIGAGFQMLGSSRAATLVSQLQRYVRHSGFAQVRDSTQHADRFADTVASVEYYVEAVRDGLPQAARILDDMANYVEQLDFVEEPAAPAEAEPEAGAVEAPAAAAAESAEAQIAEVLAAAEEAARSAAVASAAAVRAAEPAPKTGPAASEVDPEIREIFLEEAAEVLDTLQGELPRWTRDPDNRESLTTIRRGFHTLKGSGRMVGATHIGEFGLAIEELLNKSLDGTVAVSAQVVATVNEAVAMLQELIDGYREELPAPASLASLVGRAQNLAAGRSEAEQAEPEVVSIFREDAREKLDLVTTWLSSIEGLEGDFPVDNDVVRAFHTLKGAAHVVSAPAISELSAALETYLDASRSANLRLSPLAVELIRDAARTIAGWVEQAGTPAVLKQSAQPWFARIEEVQAHVPLQAVQATTDRQLAEVFASEAFDLVEKLEETSRAWGRAPDNRQAPRDLKLTLHTLMGAALMSGCPAMGNAARALHDRMDECISGEVIPDAVAFAVLADMTEGMYQQLDAFREGSLQDDGLLMERARTFGWRGGDAGARPTWQPVARAAAPAAAPEPDAAPAAETVDQPAPEIDQELLEIFLGEAEELLETMDRATSALEFNPSDAVATGSLKRALHTLKGSARMAGMSGIGEIGHLLESLMEDVERGTVRLDAAIFARLHNASDGLNYALDDIRRGRVPNVAALLGELQTELQAQAPRRAAGEAPGAPSRWTSPGADASDAEPGAAGDLPASQWTPAEAPGASAGDLPASQWTPAEAPGATSRWTSPGADASDAEPGVAGDLPASQWTPAEAPGASAGDFTASKLTPAEAPGATSRWTSPGADASDAEPGVAGDLPASQWTPAEAPGASAGDLPASQWTPAEAPAPEAPATIEVSTAVNPAEPVHEQEMTLSAEAGDLGIDLSDEALPLPDAPIASISDRTDSDWTPAEAPGASAGDRADSEWTKAAAPGASADDRTASEWTPAEAPGASAGDRTDSGWTPADAPGASAGDRTDSGWTPAEAPGASAGDRTDSEWTPAGTLEAGSTAPGIGAEPDAEQAPAWSVAAAPTHEPEPSPITIEAGAQAHEPPLSQTSRWTREDMPAAAQILIQPAAPREFVPQALPEDFDPELAQIFSGEAAELLEALTGSLNLWQVQPGHLEPARDMQRSLHTLKGGARMAGLNAMGSVAHEMETRINSIELGRGRADADAFQHLQLELERLQRMHDLLERGDIASLASADSFHLGPAPESVTAEAAAPEPGGDDPAAVEASPAEALMELPPMAAPAPQASAWDAALFWVPDDQEATAAAAARRETARVQVESLDKMLNEAGEISIYRSRLEEHNTGFQAQLTEMSQAITRIRDQLRNMEVETEAQIAARGIASGAGEHRYEGQFDPLEMDRYTRMQELSRALSESIGDLAGLHATMDEIASEAETLLLQQGRVNTEVQTGLMRTLMVPFSRQVARLQRVVKQVAQENGKQAEALFSGIESELDRNVLERMTAPLEHLLRNSVVHGIEDPEARVRAGKPAIGRVAVSLYREGAQLFIELRDDGKGLDFQAIRETAIKRGLMPEDAQLKDEDVAQFIFEPGFSTAKRLTQDAGRGIGMDVVASEVKQLGGTLDLGSETGKGARFLIRLPLTLALSQALLVGVGPEQYAIPLPSIEGIARLPRDQLDNYYRDDGPLFGYGGHEYRVRYLGDFIGVQRDQASESKNVSAILVRIGEGLGATERRVAVVVDGLFGNREIVSKAVGPQVSSLAGVTGATILADGRVVLILDIGALAADRTRRALLTLAHGKAEAKKTGEDMRDLVMVVDDSITIRRVTERLLVKHGFRVVTAKDGLDAMAQLQTESPKAILLDIEMPKADGFEVAAFIRNSERIRETPIIMITSRSGEKHRERARSIGVNRYMIKPFQEENLVGEIRAVMQEAVIA